MLKKDQAQGIDASYETRWECWNIVTFQDGADLEPTNPTNPKTQFLPLQHAQDVCI